MGLSSERYKQIGTHQLQGCLLCNQKDGCSPPSKDLKQPFLEAQQKKQNFSYFYKITNDLTSVPSTSLLKSNTNTWYTHSKRFRSTIILFMLYHNSFFPRTIPNYVDLTGGNSLKSCRNGLMFRKSSLAKGMFSTKISLAKGIRSKSGATHPVKKFSEYPHPRD